MDNSENTKDEEFKFLNELGRKTVHLSIWAIPLTYHVLMPALGLSEYSLLLIQLALVGFLCLFIPLEFYRLKINPNTWINHLMRAPEKEGPANYILTNIVWLILMFGVNIFYEMEVAELVLLATVMGDSAAALVGKGVGHRKLPLTNEKTVEGFFAGLLTNYFVGLCFLIIVWPIGINSILFPLVPMLVWGLLDFLEDLPWYLADNLFGPPFSAIIIAILIFIF